MLRTTFALLAALTSFCMTSMADDANKKEKPQDVKKLMVTFVTADVAKNTVTFKETDPSGKRTEIKLPLDKNVKVIGSDDKPEPFSEFVKTIKGRYDKSIYIIEDKEHQHILQIQDIKTF